MANLFISFLGLGNPRRNFALDLGAGEQAHVGYESLPHRLGSQPICITSFSQEAAVLASGLKFDRLVLLVTPESRQRHEQALRARLSARGVDGSIQIAELPSSDQSQSAQWDWFETVFKAIERDDEVVFDFTHGFRSVPIVLSSAIGFVQQVKPFRLRHAFYTFKREEDAELVDLAPFYEINRWSQAVGTLVRGGDASHLAEVAGDETSSAFRALSDPQLVHGLEDLTRAVKDVDMNGITARAGAVLDRVTFLLSSKTDAPERHLLALVTSKFGALAVEDSGRVDADYFTVQLALARVMLAHGLRMQGYTLMRELVGSLGVLWAKPKYGCATRDSDKGRKARRYAEIFLRMLGNEEPNWNFAESEGPRVQELRVLWDALGEADVRDGLVRALTSITKVRNGLDHGWTSRSGASAREPDESMDHLRQLEELFRRCREQGLLSPRVSRAG